MSSSNGSAGYQFTTLDAPGDALTMPAAINDAGLIVGYAGNIVPALYGTDFDALSYQNGAFAAITPPGATFSEAVGVNTLGDVVGYYYTGSTGQQGFVDQNGTVSTVDYPGAQSTSLTGISASGTVVGNAFLNGHQQGFIENSGTFSAVSPPGATNTTVTGINDTGEVVGYDQTGAGGPAYFVDQNGQYTNITLPGEAYTANQAVGAINDSGTVVGTYLSNNTQLGFIYQGGSITTLAVPGATGTNAITINNLGEVAGTYTDSSGEHGFVYQDGTYTTMDAPGATFTIPLKINDLGQIVGYDSTSTGENGFLASPANSPTVQDFGTGLVDQTQQSGSSSQSTSLQVVQQQAGGTGLNTMISTVQQDTTAPSHSIQS